MEVNIKHYNEKYSFCIPDDSDLDDIYELCKKICFVLGYYPERVIEYFEGEK